MGVQIDGKTGSFLQCTHQFICSIGSQKTRHILDTQGICAHIFDSSGNVSPVIQSIGITQSIAECDLGMALFLLRSFYCRLQIPDIIQTVKNTNNINTVCNGLLYEVFHYIICIMIITQDILSAEQHLQLGILKSIPQLS